MHETICKKSEKTKYSMILVFGISLILSATSLSQEPSWLATLRSLPPLTETRDAVRTRIGSPYLVEGNRDFFNFAGGKLVATYSTGHCANEDEWNVPKDTLLRFDYETGSEVLFSKIRANLTGYKRLRPKDTPDLLLLTNKKVGIEFTVFQNLLTDVSVFPKETASSKRCKSNSTGQSSIGYSAFSEMKQ